MLQFSLEATRPKPAEIEALRGILAPGTPIYLSCVIGKDPLALATHAALVRKAGFEPVPHLAARGFADVAVLKSLLTRLRDEAAVRRVLVIAGDRDRPLGPYADALAIIESGLLQAAGIAEVGISGYPDGHPTIAQKALDAAMTAKLAAAARNGLRAHIVGQFCFDPVAIIAWIRRLRAHGINQLIRVGLVGPTQLSALLRFAKRCGVQASLRGLIRGGAAMALFGPAHPGAALKALARADGLGEIAPHFFSFGGVKETARYAVERTPTRRPSGDMEAANSRI